MVTNKYIHTQVREYFEYFSKNPNTLISKFLGIYKVSPSWNKTIKAHNQEVVVVVMNNVFANADNLHHVFDIKGCTAGRFVANPKRSLERAATRKGIPRALATKETLKDGNFDCDLYLSRSSRNSFLKQLRSDGEFLKRCNIMDYSLLLGVCTRHDQEEEEKKENVLQGSMRARMIPRHTQARYRKGGMEHIDERVFREGT